MSGAFALDIETIPNEDSYEFLPEINETTIKLGNTKDEAKIQAKIEKAREDQREKMALSPFYGRVASFSFYGQDEAHEEGVLENGILGNEEYRTEPDNPIYTKITNTDEAGLIEDLLVCMRDILKRDRKSRLISFNGKAFDFPFIFQRAAILGLEPLKNFKKLDTMTSKYSNYFHIDLMISLFNGGFGKLGDASRVYLNENKVDISFQEFPILLSTPEGRSKILHYNDDDSRKTYLIYKACEPFMFTEKTDIEIQKR